MPDRESGKWLGYEIGKEQFTREDGTTVVDTAKASYYMMVNYGKLNPSELPNVWPEECELRTPVLGIGQLMFESGQKLLKLTGTIPDSSGVVLDDVNGVGRMLHYMSDPSENNPLLCGEHKDHGLITALLSPFYTQDGKPIPEPDEAGLFVQPPHSDKYLKVASNDPEVLLFQAGEFAQLATNSGMQATNGGMQATKHLVRKAAQVGIERFTMAVFIGPDNNAAIRSTDTLTTDPRYAECLAKSGDGTCRYPDWHIASMKKYEAPKPAPLNK